MSRRPSISDFLTNLEQPMPLGEKFTKLTRNLWRRVVLRQNCAVGITVNRAAERMVPRPVRTNTYAAITATRRRRQER
jgi:hypothetical protein